MRAHTWRTLTLFGALAMATTGVVACGSDGSSDDDGVAAIGDTAADGATADSATPAGSDEANVEDPEAPTDRDDAFALFEECMTDHGFPMDAGPGTDGPVVVESASGGPGSGPVVAGPGGTIPPEDVEEFEAANETCRAHLANVENELDISPEQQAAMEDAVLAMQQCMNDKGFDVQFGIALESAAGGSVSVEPPDLSDAAEAPTEPGEVDEEALAAAEEECSAVFDDYPELDDVPLPGR